MADYASEQSRGQASSVAAHASGPSPGKRTLTEQAYGGRVQQRAKAGGAAVHASTNGAVSTPSAPSPGDWVQRIFGGVQRSASGAATADVHAAAARGIESPATRLPFADQIQASFGPHHDVTSIQAHVGEAATAAASAMGASAYAKGNHTVFAGAPDLHTAAHETAHVVQQRAGVHLSGGVGQVGDAYERHADAVADRVVQGQSAADLLAPQAHAAPDRAHEDPIQHACSDCGGAVSGAGECTTCNAGAQGKATPVDEREPASKLGAGTSQPTQNRNDPIQKQDAPAEQNDGPALTGGSAGADQGQAPAATQVPSTWGWGGEATRNVYAPCNIVEMDRAAFLAFEAGALARGGRRASLSQTKGGFGITTSTVSNSKPPPIEAEPIQDGGRTRFRLKPTHAEMAPIESAVTIASEFVEGVFHYNTQGGTICPSKNYPMRWVLTPDGVAKVKQGEQEHCNDFRAAFDNTLALYASSINNVAAANRVYTTEKQAIGDALSYLGMSQPGEMMASYQAAAARTRLRDNSAHIPRLPPHPQPDPGCNEVRIVLGAGAWSAIPGMASEDLVNPHGKP